LNKFPNLIFIPQFEKTGSLINYHRLDKLGMQENHYQRNLFKLILFVETEVLEINAVWIKLSGQIGIFLNYEVKSLEVP